MMPPAVRSKIHAATVDECSPEFIVDMRAEDVVEARLRGQPERPGPRGIEIARPSRDDADDRLVRLMPDPRHHLVAGNPPERRDLLADRHRQARQGHRPARPDGGKIERRRMHQETNRRARAGMPMADILAHRQDRLVTRQGFADDVGKEARGRLVRLARTHADRRQPDGQPIEYPAPAVVGQQQFADRLLRAVGGQRRGEELIADRLRKRRTEHRDRRGEHHPRPIAVADGADGIEQKTRAVEIDPIALVEIRFRLARHDRCQMEDHVRPRRHQPFGLTGRRQVALQRHHRTGRASRIRRHHHILQRHRRDLASPERPVRHQPVGQLRADHSGRADDENMHGVLLDHVGVWRPPTPSRPSLLAITDQSAKPPSTRWICPVV